MSNCKIYDPAEARFIVDGVDITGYADGEKIVIEPVTAELYKTHVGVDGDVSYVKVNDPRFVATLNLKQDSPSNPFLDLMMKSPACFAVGVTNPAGGKYLGAATNCRIMQRKKRTFGSDPQKREWKIMMPDYTDADLPE